MSRGRAGLDNLIRGTPMKLRATASAFALGMLAAACSQGSNIASPGSTTPTTPPTGGGSGGGGGGGGTPTASCPTGFTQDAATTGGLVTCVVSGTITSDLTLPFVSGTAFRLSGRVDVGVDVGATGAQTGGDPAVLTIEPGIYFIPELIDMWQKQNRYEEFINYQKVEEYRDFGGIRIEDDVLVTEDSYRVLGSKPIPKSVEEVEALASI